MEMDASVRRLCRRTERAEAWLVQAPAGRCQAGGRRSKPVKYRSSRLAGIRRWGMENAAQRSNAALLAPAFINTKAKLLTFGSGNYTVDFSQHNIILMYYNEPNYSKVEVTLPSESSVAYKFGMSYLPTDFAAIVTFRVRPGSKNIILKGIYNHNEDLQNYEMASGDSVTVLIY